MLEGEKLTKLLIAVVILSIILVLWCLVDSREKQLTALPKRENMHVTVGLSDLQRVVDRAQLKKLTRDLYMKEIDVMDGTASGLDKKESNMIENDSVVRYGLREGMEGNEVALSEKLRLSDSSLDNNIVGSTIITPETHEAVVGKCSGLSTDIITLTDTNKSFLPNYGVNPDGTVTI